MQSTTSPHIQTEASFSQEAADFLSPEYQSMISITTYAEMREIIENFINSKRYARDTENNYHFLKAGPRSNCARIDAVYSVRAGVTSHIKVQDKDQYWAEEERKFPHLKEIHLKEEISSTVQEVVRVQEVKCLASESGEPSVSLLLDIPAHPLLTSDISPERSLDDQLTQSKEVDTSKRDRESQRSAPSGITRWKDGNPPPKKIRIEKSVKHEQPII